MFDYYFYYYLPVVSDYIGSWKAFQKRRDIMGDIITASIALGVVLVMLICGAILMDKIKKRRAQNMAKKNLFKRLKKEKEQERNL